jgi:hypothetical protein
MPRLLVPIERSLIGDNGSKIHPAVVVDRQQSI